MAYYDLATTLANITMVRYPERGIADLGYRMQAVMPLLNKIKRKAGGKNFSFSVMTHRGNDTQFYTESASLITPTADTYVRGYVDYTTVVSKQLLTQEAISDTADDAGALFSVIAELPQRIANNHSFHIANNAWALDSLGKLATCGTTSASSTVVLATTANTRKFYSGQVVDVKTSSTGNDTTNGGSLTIIGVSDPTATTKSIVVDTTTITTTSSHGVYGQDETSGTTAYCWNPIPALVDTTTIHNITITSTSNFEFKSYLNTATGALTLPKIQTMVDWIEAFHKAGNEGLVMFVSPEVLIKYGDLLIADTRYTQENLKRMEGGYPTDIYYRGGSMGLIPIVKDALMPIDEIYVISPKALRLFYSAWWEWFDKGGSKFIPSSTLGYELRFFSRGNLAIVDRSGCGKLQAITL